jgi:hypothetical protein
MRRALSLLALFVSIAFAPRAHAADDAADTARDARKRMSLRTYHFSMGITTWASLGATNLLGTIRYANVIGFGDPLCREGGSPIFGRSWGCGDGLKYQHLVSATFTTASYATTRTLAALMPDPYGAAVGPSSQARRLRIHRALSWVHLAGMVAMPVLGFATAMSSDPNTRRTLATTHLVVGWSTFGAVSAAGLVWVF